MIVSSADVDSVFSGDSLLAYTMIASIAVITILVGGYMVTPHRAEWKRNTTTKTMRTTMRKAKMEIIRSSLRIGPCSCGN